QGAPARRQAALAVPRRSGAPARRNEPRARRRQGGARRRRRHERDLRRGRRRGQSQDGVAPAAAELAARRLMRRACVLAAALLTLGCDREPKRPAGATASSVSARPLAAPTPPPPEPVVVERATACRLLRVSGDVRAEGGAALAERPVLDG